MKKLNIVLIIILLALLCGVGFLGFTLFTDMNSIKAPDLSTGTLSDVDAWCASLKDNPCAIEYEYSDTVEKNGVIYQSIKAGEVVDGSITFRISDGPDTTIVLPDNIATLTKTDIGTWVSQNALTNVTYNEEFSDTIEADHIISITPLSTPIVTDTPVMIVVSKGAENTKTIVNGEIEVTSGEFVGMTLSSFETTVKKVNLVPYHNSNKDDYDDTVAKGNIVWHGYGTYTENENISYGLSLGPSSDENTITITKNTYLNKTVTEFETAVKALGLVPSKTTDYEDYSDTVTKGNILWHGSGDYVDGETIRYSLSLGPESGSSSSTTTTVTDEDRYITKNKYLGYTVTQFETAAKALGLVPSKTTDYEDYSDTVPAGNILWHGYGQYEDGETFRYSVSLGSQSGTSTTTTVTDEDRYITKNKYLGYTVAQFETAAKALGLVPSKTTDYEDYSDTVPAGNILWHGYGQYVEGETFRYSVSLGSRSGSSSSSSGTSSQCYVASETYKGKTVSEFETAVKALGLVPAQTTEKEDYSSTVAAGNILWHGYGYYTTGETIRYSVSLGVETTEITLGSVQDLGVVTVGSGTPSFENSKNNITNYLKNSAGFTNVTVNGTTSNDTSEGYLISVTVNGVNHVGRATYSKDAAIVVTISTGMNS
ncbi:MAG: hypothetical protein Q4D13_01580 [Erysipelotrichaceae bacterium]|nr:hypothetical protein [Erysipelotrichaceae bacterium]